MDFMNVREVSNSFLDETEETQFIIYLQLKS